MLISELTGSADRWKSDVSNGYSANMEINGISKHYGNCQELRIGNKVEIVKILNNIQKIYKKYHVSENK